MSRWVTKTRKRTNRWTFVRWTFVRWTFVLLATWIAAGLLPAAARAHAAPAPAPKLGAALLPAAGDAQGAQLAVSWRGAPGLSLRAALAAPGAGERVVAERPLQAGVNLVALPAGAAAGGTLRLAVRDAAGATVETLSRDVGALRAASGFAWESRFFGPGVDNPVAAVAVFDDGSGPALYVGGQFATAGAQQANGIARWDGTAWSALGSGVASGGTPSVSALAVYDGALIVAGAFSSAGGVAADNIARWDGHQWSALGSGTNGGVSALAVYGGALVAAGGFTTAGGVAANRIARWNGTTWSALGSGLDNSAFALAVWNGALVAGGNFASAGGVAANRVARWDGAAWTALAGSAGVGVNGQVRALAAFGDDLVVGGSFTSAGGRAAERVARWDGRDWFALGDGVSGGGPGASVAALAVYDGALIAAGAFMQSGSTYVGNIARWDGQAWRALPAPGGVGLSGGAAALATFRGELVVAGTFTQVGGQPPPLGGGLNSSGIARWNGTTWASLEPAGTGLSSQVSAFAVYQGDLYVGGSFTRAGSADAWGIARWDGVAWHPLRGALGSGVMTLPFDFVGAMVVHDGALYVGGQFSMAGGQPANGVARWDGHEWSPLAGSAGIGLGDSAAAFALAVYQGDLIAAGSFTTAGGHAAANIARWDGHDWSPLGAGTNQTITSLAVYGDALVAGGGFSQAGDVATDGIARWNGSAWSALGAGLDGDVRALAVYDGALIAAGGFTHSGSLALSHVARWDGSAWSALGAGLDNYAYALGVYAGGLIVGGGFSHAGGVAASGIARWDGSAWSALSGPAGEGIGGAPASTVFALLPWDADGSGPLPEKLVVGGTFLATGGVTNWRIGLYGPTDPVAHLSVTPAAVDFGDAQLPGAVIGPLAVTLASTGNQPVHVAAMDEAATPFHRAGGDCPGAPFDLPAGASCTMSFVFVPIAAGNFAQTVTLHTDGGDAAFTLSGRGVAPPPVIRVDPLALATELPRGTQATLPLAVANDGGSDLVWTLASGPAPGLRRPVREATAIASASPPPAVDAARLRRSARTPAPEPAAAPVAPDAGERIVLSHSASTAIAPDTLIGCYESATGRTRENRFLRTFTLADFGIDHDFEVAEVTFGVQSLSPARDVTVNLYTLDGALAYANLHPLGSQTVHLPVQQGTLVKVPVHATAPAGATLVVELVAPELGAGWFYPGFNAAGETAPSYLSAPACGLDEPVTLASLGIDDAALVMQVAGLEPVDCGVPGWLSLAPSAGTVAAGATQTVQASLDAHGLAVGDHHANLCLASNDPVPLLTVVPVDLHVTPGQDGELAVAPAAVDFGVVPVGGSAAPAVVTLTNAGGGALRVNAVDAAAAPFARSGGDCPAAPFDLAPSATCTLAYAFAPTRLGAFAQTLAVSSDGGEATIALSGVATPGAPATLALLGGSGQSAPVGGAFALPLAVQVRDAWNNPVPGVAVAFSAPASGAGATLSAPSATSDANGYAAVTAVANAQAGSYEVHAGVAGLGEVAFALTNLAAVADVGATIVADRAYVRAGGLLNYVVTLRNAGPAPAHGAAIAAQLSPLLDAGAASWLCLGPAESGCTPAGQGALDERDLDLPPGASVSWLLTAPVRRDAGGDLVESAAAAALGGDPQPGNDHASARSAIVVLRDGFEPYGDGADALVPVDGALGAGDVLQLVWPSAPAGGLAEVLRIDAPAQAGQAARALLRIERLDAGAAAWLRLVGSGVDGGEQASAWIRVEPDARLTLLAPTAQAPAWQLFGTADALSLPADAGAIAGLHVRAAAALGAQVEAAPH